MANYETTLTSSEILRALKQEGDSLRKPAESPKEETKPVVNEADLPFRLSLAEYPDFIIEKKMKTVTKLLVFMPSAGNAFIKTIKGESSSSEQLTEGKYASFTSGMEDIILPKGFWTHTICRGLLFGRELLKIIYNPELCEMLRKKGFPDDFDIIQDRCPNYYNHKAGLDDYMAAYSTFKNLYLENLGRKKALALLVNINPDFCSFILDKFGYDSLRDFLKKYQESLLKHGASIYYPHSSGKKSLWASDLDYRSFRDYVLYDSVNMGYALSPREFVCTWEDTIEMEKMVYGKIKDKYPKNLPLLHQQMSYKAACMKEEYDRKLFAQHSKEAQEYEGKSDGFVYIAPRSKQDFLDEATMQGNCLAGYIDNFIEGNCLILFMRKAETPDESYITVELIEGEVVQAKRERNLPLSWSESASLNKWIEKCNEKKKEEKMFLSA